MIWLLNFTVYVNQNWCPRISMKPLHVVLSLPQSLVHTPTLSLVIPSIVDSVPTSSLTSVDPRYWKHWKFHTIPTEIRINFCTNIVKSVKLCYMKLLLFFCFIQEDSFPSISYFFLFLFLWKSIVIHKETDMNSKMTCPKMNKHFPLTLKIVYKCIA